MHDSQKTKVMSFITEKIVSTGLTFDDVSLIPAFSQVLPREVDTSTPLSKSIKLNIPIISAAMDTVTEVSMAVALAQSGGIGVIHKSMPIEEQSRQVLEVKSTKAQALACVDRNGRLRVAAAIGIDPDSSDRIDELVKVGVDAIVIDTAHGHSKLVLDLLRKSKSKYPQVDFIVGNIATAQAATDMALAGADAVKVGLGSGSICTTRVVTGVGIPQLSAIYNVSKALRNSNIPVIADGGIRHSGDIAKALAAGASSVMIGCLFAGTDEAVGSMFTENGMNFKKYRGMGAPVAVGNKSNEAYRMGIMENIKKLVPEGIEANVPYRGAVSDVIFQLIGGLRSGMGYCGAADIKGLHSAKFVKITKAGITESGVHNVILDE